MPTLTPISFRTPRAFGAWLAKHHGTERELVIRLFKVHAKHRGIGYAEALDEALCWGWIDGLVRRYDADSYTQRFTPRKPKSIWSVVNIRHGERLTAAGRMQPPGLAAFEARTAGRSGVYSFEQKAVELAPAYASRFRREKAAWSWFKKQAPYYRRTSTHWVMSAKREETRLRRLGTLIECSREAVRIPALRPSDPKR